MQSVSLILLLLHLSYTENVENTGMPYAMAGVNPDEYGPYKMEFKEYEKCKGPKRTECTSFSLSYVLEERQKVTIEMNVTKSCIIEHCRITAKVYKGNKSKQVFNYNIDKPCQHFAIGPTLTKFGNVTKNCALPQGTLRVTMDVAEQTYAFFGKNFFYGEFEFKVIVTTKVSNIFCLASHVLFEKKT